MAESPGENVARRTLNLSVRGEEGRVGSLTVPGLVKRRGRLVCRTDQPFLHLNTQDVMEPHSSSLNLTLTTDAPVGQHFKLTVSLESNQLGGNWKAVSTAR